MPNKTGRKELSSDKIAVILTLHKLGYTASQIGREEGLTKTDNSLVHKLLNGKGYWWDVFNISVDQLTIQITSDIILNLESDPQYGSDLGANPAVVRSCGL